MSCLTQRAGDLKFTLAGEPAAAAAVDGLATAAAAGDAADVTARVMAALRSAFPEAGEDLSGLLAHSEIFDLSRGGAERMCKEMGVRLLGRVPIDPALGRAAEAGCSVFAMPPPAGPGAATMMAQPAPVCLPALCAIVEQLVEAVGP